MGLENSINSPAPRIPLHVKIEFKKSYARSASAGVLKNISLTGAFLSCDSREVQENEKLTVMLSVSGRVRKVQAVVIWKNELGSGIKFLPTNKRDTQIVDDLMYFVETRREDQKGLLDNILNNVD